jgi:phosphatidylethanolamine-binding protein (PEBP) family uncharacterized protein
MSVKGRRPVRLSRKREIRRSKRPRCRSRRQRGGAQPTLKIIFPSGAAAATTAEPEPLFKKENTIPQPSIKLEAASPGLKTLICTDPDAPGGAAPWLHWLIVNWKGDSEPNPEEIVMPWAPPTPPPGSGEHRYQFRVYAQPGGTAISLPKATNNRAAFPLDSFIAKHGLQLLAEASFKVAASST